MPFGGEGMGCVYTCESMLRWTKPFRTTLKPWLKPLFVGISQGVIIPRISGWCRISSVRCIITPAHSSPPPPREFTDCPSKGSGKKLRALPSALGFRASPLARRKAGRWVQRPSPAGKRVGHLFNPWYGSKQIVSLAAPH